MADIITSYYVAAGNSVFKRGSTTILSDSDSDDTHVLDHVL